MQDLTTSSSGLWFNDVHPLLTFDNMEAIAPQYSGFNEDALTAWLKEKTEAGILGAVEDWIRAKFEVRTVKNLLESQRLFDVASRTDQKDVNQSKLVGLEIIPTRTRGVKAKIERIGLQFDTAQTITVSLYRVGTTAAIQSQAITYSVPNDLEWTSVNWEIDGHGAYYLVYDQSAITGQSINGIYDYRAGSEALTSTAVVERHTMYYPIGRYLMLTPFQNPGGLNPKDHAYTMATNYGVNLEFNVYCDYTDFIVRHANILKGLIQKRVGMDLLREIAYNANTRVNRHESNSTINQILYEIDGDSQGRPGGLRHQYDMELKATAMDQESIDPVCAPCRRRAVRYKAI